MTNSPLGYQQKSNRNQWEQKKASDQKIYDMKQAAYKKAQEDSDKAMKELIKKVS